MPGISKAIELVKVEYKNNEVLSDGTVLTNRKKFMLCAANSIMSIITAYEQSQTKMGQMESAIFEDYKTSSALRAELDTANKRIAELENAPVGMQDGIKVDWEKAKELYERMIAQEQTDGFVEPKE